jgi:hypothetical protein
MVVCRPVTHLLLGLRLPSFYLQRPRSSPPSLTGVRGHPPLAFFISLGRLIGTYNQFLYTPQSSQSTFVSASLLLFCAIANTHSTLPIPPPRLFSSPQRLTMLSSESTRFPSPRYDLVYAHTLLTFFPESKILS